MDTFLEYRPVHVRRARWLLAIYLTVLLTGFVGLFMGNENGIDSRPVPPRHTLPTAPIIK